MNTKPQENTQDVKSPKQPYEKPQVIYRAPLEATAGDCSASPGKASLGSCNVLQS